MKRKRPHKGKGSTTRTPTIPVESSQSKSSLQTRPVRPVSVPVRLIVVGHGKSVQLTRPLAKRKPSSGMIPTFVRWVRRDK